MAKIFNYGFIQPMFNSSTMGALAGNSWISPINVRTNEANTLIQNKIIKQ